MDEINYKSDKAEFYSNEDSNINLNMKTKNEQGRKSKNIEVLNEEKEQELFTQNLKQCLKKLFNFYASFGNRLTNFKMNSTQFLKLMNDAGITSKQLTPKKIQLHLIGINRNQQGIDYSTFVKVLNVLAQEIYPNNPPNSNLLSLLEDKIIPLFNQIYNETDFGVEDKILNGKINIATLMIIHYRKDILFSIYSKYFEHEKNSLNLNISDQSLAEKSKQAILLFLRDFEILPSLLNIGIVNNFFNELAFVDFGEKNSNQGWSDLSKTIGFVSGRVFLFTKFAYFLIKISVYVFSDRNNTPKQFRELSFSNDEKFYLLLERLEISTGFSDIAYGKFGKPAGKRLTLMSKELADLHKETSSFLNFEDYIDDSENTTFMLLNFNFEVRISKPKHALISKLVEQNVGKNNDTNKTSHFNVKKKENENLILNPDFEDAIEKFKTELRKVFSYYSSINERDQIEAMNCFRFIIFLKDINIIKSDHQEKNNQTYHLLTKQADILFNSLTHNKQPVNKTNINKQIILLIIHKHNLV